MKSTPLHLAYLRRSLDIVKLLLQYNVDLNCQDSDLNTPLHISSELGELEILEFLLKNGEDATIKNTHQKTPYDVTMSSEVRKLLQKYVAYTFGYQSRSEIGGQIVRNSRADHIERLLGKVMDLSRLDILKQQQQMNSVKDKKESISVNISSPDGYIFHKLLEKRLFGDVYLATRKQDGEQFAIKILCKERVFTNNITRYVQTEKNVLSVIKLPFIVGLHAAFQNSSKLFMVQAFCPGGDLEQFLHKNGKLSENVARFYLCEIILVIETLHKNGIIFRNLKPKNV